MHTLAQQIHHHLRTAGPQPFAWFMTRALYHPTLGYYAQTQTQPGRHGDFYTSVSVGPLFAELLARQFATWLHPHPHTPPPHPVHLVEAGAHDGQCAADLLPWIDRHRPLLAPHLQYLILEPLPTRAAQQQARLAPFHPRIRWFAHWDELPDLHGVIFSNELLDAFPVHRLGWDAPRQRWFEWGVATLNDQFLWTRLGPWTGPPPLPEPLQHSLGPLLPDSFTLESSPQAAEWWSKAARHLRSGHLLTFDYGLELEERLAPHRHQGTLRSYRHHQITPNPLEAPGTQDLTAHVDFTALRTAGETAGLQSEPLLSQAAFLTRIVQSAHLHGHPPEAWTPHRQRQLQTLVHPNHLGHTFRVLHQRVAH